MEEYKNKMNEFVFDLKNKVESVLGNDFSQIEHKDKDMLDQNYKIAINEIYNILDSYRFEDNYFQKSEEILNESKYEISKFIGKSRERKNIIQNKSQQKIYTDLEQIENEEQINKDEESITNKKAIDKVGRGFNGFQEDTEYVDKEIKQSVFRAVDDNIMTVSRDKFRKLLLNYDGDFRDEKGQQALADITKALEYKCLENIKDGFEINTKEQNRDVMNKIEEALQEKLPEIIDDVKKDDKEKGPEEINKSEEKLSLRDELKSNVVKEEDINLNALAFKDIKTENIKEESDKESEARRAELNAMFK